MTPILRTAPISDMKINQGNVMGMLDAGPVVLMQRSTPAAVMVNPTLWNQMAKRLSDLEGFMHAMELSRQTEEDPSELVDFDELCQRLNLDPKQLATSKTTES